MIRATGILLTVLAAPAFADNGLVYESYEGVTIGRVFLSPAEREYLDARRHLKPEPAGADPGPESTMDDGQKAPPPAGFIIGPNGKSKIWKEGDFVDSAASSMRTMAFPGDVEIVRHVAKDGSGDEE